MYQEDGFLEFLVEAGVDVAEAGVDVAEVEVVGEVEVNVSQRESIFNTVILAPTILLCQLQGECD